MEEWRIVFNYDPSSIFYLSLERKIAHRKCAIEQNLKNRKANTNYGLATGDLNAFLLLKITG
jgi:hypothetical protein